MWKTTVYGVAAVIGFALVACVASTLDHPGSIPVTDGQLAIAAAVGIVIMAIGTIGLRSIYDK